MIGYTKVNLKDLKIGDRVRVWETFWNGFDEYQPNGAWVIYKGKCEFTRPKTGLLKLFPHRKYSILKKGENVKEKVKAYHTEEERQALMNSTCFRWRKEEGTFYLQDKYSNDRVRTISSTGVSEVTRFCVYAEELSKVVFSNTSVCHAGLNSLDVDPISHLSSIIMLEELYEEACAFYQWLLNYSPFREAFLTKDIEEAFKYGIAVDIEKPGAYLASALIASRWPSEFKHRTTAWYEMVKAGVEPSKAFIISSMVKKSGTMFRAEFGSNHMPFDMAYKPFTTYYNFVNDNPSFFTGSYKKELSYRSVNETWKKEIVKGDGDYYTWRNKVVSIVDGAEKLCGPFGTKVQGRPIKEAYAMAQEIIKILET